VTAVASGRRPVPASVPEGRRGSVSRGSARPRHVLLLDGSNFMHRAFHSLREPRTLTALPHRVRGMLAAVLDRWDPTDLVWMVDSPVRCFRHDHIPEYKADREDRDGPGTGDMLRALRPALYRWNVATREAPGFEADDGIAAEVARLVAAVAAGTEPAGLVVSILSGDMDLLQLVSDAAGVRVLRPEAGGETVLDEAGVQAYTAAHSKYGAPLRPDQLLDLRTLAGGKDKLPRVELRVDGERGAFGFSTRRAAQLLAAGATLESLAGEHAGLLRGKEPAWLAAGLEAALRRREVLRLRTDCVPVGTIGPTAVAGLQVGSVPEWETWPTDPPGVRRFCGMAYMACACGCGEPAPVHKGSFSGFASACAEARRLTMGWTPPASGRRRRG
jgi:5'-3' exonuclease